MQTWAYELISDNPFLDSNIKIKLIKLLSDFSGAKGMIAGQVYDVKQKQYTVDSDYLKKYAQVKNWEINYFASFIFSFSFK